MQNLVKITILFLSLTLIQCSSDDDSSSSADLLYNGSEFKTGNGSTYNIIKSESENGFWLDIREKTDGEVKVISIFANHAAGTHSGTYTLKSNQSGPGLATLAIMDGEGHQVLGGDTDGQDGTISVIDYGNHKLKITFNDVNLDVGPGEGAVITGSVVKSFTPAVEQ